MKLVTFMSIEYAEMSEIQIKRFFQDRGLKLIDVARELAKQFSVTEASADVMLHDLLAGRRWYPVYATWLKETYGITFLRPVDRQPVRERMRQAA
ncbi:MAG: hypothetical protein ABI539_08375 [Acidobacteriota bacterium]